MNENAPDSSYFRRQHYLMRFSDLGELFVARLLLLKFQALTTDDGVVQFSLHDFFPGMKSLHDLELELEGVTFEISDRITETVADFMTSFLGSPQHPTIRLTPATDFYNEHLVTRLGFLRDGDSVGDLLPGAITSFEVDDSHSLHVYSIRADRRVLAEHFSQGLRTFLELKTKMITTVAQRGLLSKPNIRIDYRKPPSCVILCPFPQNPAKNGHSKYLGATSLECMRDDIQAGGVKVSE